MEFPRPPAGRYPPPVTHLSALLLGALQGLTEFLPISSDGHLVLVSRLLGETLEGRSALGFDILLHAGSLLALLLMDRVFWWKTLSCAARGQRPALRLLGLLIIATVPAAIAGVLLEDLIADRLRTPMAAGIGFLVTAGVLWAGEEIGRYSRKGIEGVDGPRAFLLGCAQAVAILPGVSRSACTASFARVLGLERRAAIDFSFLMAVPVIGGAVAKTALDALSGEVTFPPPSISLVGFAASFAVSLGAIVLLRRLVVRFSLAWFAVYLVPLGLLAIAYHLHANELLDPPHLELYVRRYGAAAVFVFALMESVPPVSFVAPGVVLLTIAGSLVPDVPAALLFFAAATLGAVLGNSGMFLLGRRYGRRIAHRFHLTDERLNAADVFMQRFGRLSVFFAQFVSVARPAVSFIAGATRMSRRQYFPPLLLSAALWSAFYLVFGFAVRDYIVWAASLIFSSGFVVVPLVAAVLAWRAAKARKKRSA